ncbi:MULTISPECIES: ABC transporter permease [Halomicrobium]|uniref:Binding-protein-dependent transport systems inner membrane component n=2 Tax=Halomicrobium mukohataei TaxID=57705 RepID=C7NYL3_HALMD|nr:MULTISPECIES: ABC transporter permease [Halomicrobium]ACV46674.1 binding-protein-dependent transport systems inner membrane component [Halomicrobium mukohataei DSM 12286]QCD65183.1 ABC transporter permease [Halomicrobium mukohataei]QFR19989.1 ABC transporter permease subunit [Halomicrobium sp. ZPS1]
MGLRRFIVKRVLLTIPILFGVSIVTFGMVHLTPGDPIDVLVSFNPDVGPAEEAALRERYGYDLPVWEQYLRWIGNVLQGDLGPVITRSGVSVNDVIMNRLPETIVLGLFGWVFALVIAIPTGIYAAVNKDDLGDHVSRFIALSGISVPNFWLGLMLILFGALVFNIWPVLPPRNGLLSLDTLWFLVMPGITIGTASASTLMRIMRSSMAEELNKEYVTAARAKGLPEQTVILKHVLRNSLISVTTVAAFLTANIVAGSVVVEVVFSWPGLGREFVQAITSREVNLILAITLFTGVALVLANLLADIVYAMLDPRIRYD